MDARRKMPVEIVVRRLMSFRRRFVVNPTVVKTIKTTLNAQTLRIESKTRKKRMNLFE